MKLVSWNVNGIRAAWGRGLAALLNVREADIYAIQEVRCDQPFTAAEIDGYYPYWSLYTKRRGYSGVLCLTRTKPLRVWRTLRHPDADLLDEDGQTIDFEGRVLTLEYKDFYLINVYVPSLHSKPERKEYRAEWDIRFSTYVGFLKHDKSVIICGD